MNWFGKRVILLAILAAVGGVVLATTFGGPSSVPAPPPKDAAAASSNATAVPADPAASAANEKLAALQDRLAANPKDGDALAQTADMYLAAKRYGQAADLYAQAVEAEPVNAEYHTGYGIALFYAGMQSMGQKELKRAVELNPESAEAQFNYALAVSHGPTADPAAADSAWHAVLRLDPDGPLGQQARKIIESGS